MSANQVVIEFKYKEDTYEIEEYPIDFARIKEVIKQKIKYNGDISLSWKRTPNTDYIKIVDDNNLKRCCEYQIKNQAQQNPIEYIVSLKVTEDFGSSSDQFNIKHAEKDLSKSTQLQYPIAQKFINSSQENQFSNIQVAIPQTEYDRSKYTDYTCYNCGGGENTQIQDDQSKCPVCLGVGKLLKTKEIDTIEYLIEKKLCQLYPELKQIYKRFQQNGTQAEEVAPSPQMKAENTKQIQPVQQQQQQQQQSQQQQQIVINLVENDPKQQENTSSDQKQAVAPQSQPKPSQPKKKKKALELEFNQLFATPQNDQKLTNNFGNTPNGEDQQQQPQIMNKAVIGSQSISQDIIPATSYLKGSDELFSFDVFKHPNDKNEIIFKQNEKQVLNFEIKRKSKQWPISKLFIEEAPEKYFNNLSEKKEFDFSGNEEIQTIQLILNPLPSTQGVFISRWKLYYIDSSNEKKHISGAISFKASIQIS